VNKNLHKLLDALKNSTNVTTEIQNNKYLAAISGFLFAKMGQECPIFIILDAVFYM
jgi:hypothetical protein